MIRYVLRNLRRHQNDWQVWKPLPQFVGQVQPVKDRHADVRDDQVGLDGLNECQRLFAVTGHCDARIRSQATATSCQQVAQSRIIINNEQSHDGLKLRNSRSSSRQSLPAKQETRLSWAELSRAV